MNKFREAIRDLRRKDPRRSIGFGTAKPETGPAMLLGVVAASSGDLQKLAGSGAKLLVLDAQNATAAANAAGDLGDAGVIVGARVGELDADGRSVLQDAGFSFIISPPEKTAAAATTDEECGNVATMPLDADESTLRAFGGLEIDALMVDEDLGVLTVSRQTQIVRTSMLSGRPLLTQVGADISDGDLRVLRDSGVAGVLLDASAGEAAVSRILTALKEMPPRKEGEREERHIAIVPGLAGTHHDHDADDD